MKKPKQLSLIKKEKSSYVGELRNTRKGRLGPRPLATRETMHLVLISSKAKGAWSFRNPRHQARIKQTILKFAAKYGVVIITMANVGNHLHFQIRLTKRFFYAPFIRAITGAIAVIVTRQDRRDFGASSELKSRSVTDGPLEGRGPVTDGPAQDVAPLAGGRPKLKFWDHRPFTRLVQSLKAFFNLKDYIGMNQLDGQGYQRSEARMIIEMEKELKRSGSSASGCASGYENQRKPIETKGNL